MSAPEVFTGTWTGREAAVLQDAQRLSIEGYAEQLGIAPRTVAAWRMKPSIVPRPELQQILDTAYERAADSVRTRFAAMTGAASASGSVSLAAEVLLLQASVDQLHAQIRDMQNSREDAR